MRAIGISRTDVPNNRISPVISPLYVCGINPLIQRIKVVFPHPLAPDPVGPLGPRPPEEKELSLQIRNFTWFYWVSGGLWAEMDIHQIDEICWIKDAWPVAAHGVGGRAANSADCGQNLDSLAIEWTFADGTKATDVVRWLGGHCHPEFATYIHGTKCAAQFNTYGLRQGERHVCTRTNASIRTRWSGNLPPRQSPPGMPSGTCCWTTSATTDRRTRPSGRPTHVPAPCDGQTEGHEGMRYVLAQRDLIAAPGMHEIAKGDITIGSVRDDLDGTVNKCVDCHLLGRQSSGMVSLAPDPTAKHLAIPPLHFEALDCQACHVRYLQDSALSAGTPEVPEIFIDMVTTGKQVSKVFTDYLKSDPLNPGQDLPGLSGVELTRWYPALRPWKGQVTTVKPLLTAWIGDHILFSAAVDSPPSRRHPKTD